MRYNDLCKRCCFEIGDRQCVLGSDDRCELGYWKSCMAHWEKMNPEINDYKSNLCSECISKIETEGKIVLLKDIIKLCPRNVYIDCIKDMQGYYEINVVEHGIIFKSKHHQKFTLDEILNMRVTNFNVNPDGEFTIDVE